MDIIYLIAKKDKLYILDTDNNILYSRKNDFNYMECLKDFNNYKSFEEIFPLWKKENGVMDFTNSFYISILRKITSRDLFNVFNRYNITTDKYTYMFHNALLTDDEINNDIILKRETFFYLIPLTKSKFFSAEGNRKCIVLKIKHNINNLLDLTQSIITTNNFTQKGIKKDKITKKWISYNPLDVDKYYKNGEITEKIDDNFKCITIKNNNLKDREYCDIYEYAGRRKLQEILFKTRKYRYKKLYFEYKNNDKDEKYKIYHPLNVPSNITIDFDKFLLKELGITGFFSVDFGDAITGGEVLLIEPKKYLSKIAVSNKPCYDKEAFSNKLFL